MVEFSPLLGLDGFGPPAPPMLVAHRAGNDLAALIATGGPRLDAVEADVHYWRGRLELRHMKRLGPLPVWWDRWSVRRATTAPCLEQLLAETHPDVRLLLDLKGLDPRLPAALRRVLDEHPAGRPVSICSRNWQHLRRFPAMDHVEVVHSVGSPWQLSRIRRLAARGEVGSISINQRLLTADVAQELIPRVSRFWVWPVNAVSDMGRLQGWGVGALITDEPALLGQAWAP